MESVDIEVLRRTVDWLDRGRHVLLVTVINTWGSSPRPIGALAAICDDGRLVGSISGGCVEHQLIRCYRNAEIPALPSRQSYGVTAEEARRLGLPCGGTLELLLEPTPDASVLREVLRAIERRELIGREISIDMDQMRIVEPATQDTVVDRGNIVTVTHGPRWRMLLIGASQVSRYLSEIANALDYQVTVCDPRSEYADDWAVAGTLLDRRMPDDVVLAMRPDRQTAIITLTHYPVLDDLALLEALKSDAFYVGALGSKTTNQARRERLARFFDLTDAQIARLHGPVGLRLGSRTPTGIAVAIIAELTALRNDIVLVEQVPDARSTNQPLSQQAALR